MMKMITIEGIEAREKAATKGPWKGSLQRTYDVVAPVPKGLWPDPTDIEWHGGFPVCEIQRQNEKNRDFIAHAREDIPWLVEMVKQMKPFLNSILIASNLGMSSIDVESARALLADLED